jgi:hypothetical protein
MALGSRLELVSIANSIAHQVIDRLSVRTMRSVARLSFAILASLCMNVSGALSVERELPIEIDVSTLPHAIEATADGGVLVTLDSFPPKVLKLNASGAVEWKFEEPMPSGG